MHFHYNDEIVKWTYKRLDTSDWEPANKDLSTLITCSHPEFISIAESPSIISTSLRYLLDIGKTRNIDFFSEMEKSFFGRR